jgi:hypothetical protein
MVGSLSFFQQYNIRFVTQFVFKINFLKLSKHTLFFKERFSFLVMPWGGELPSFKVPGVGNLVHSCKKIQIPGVLPGGDGNCRN